MSYITELRKAISNTVEAKANGRAAGEGLWAWYARATLNIGDDSPKTADEFDAQHTAVMAGLNAIKELSKDERNSLTSAKCVLKGAVSRGVNVWRRDDAGSRITDENGEPIPRGKSDLQEDVSDFERVIKMLDGITKKMEAENREPFNKEQLDTIASKLLILAENVRAESASIKGKEQ